ncbi:MAG: ROK family protein [Chloroflexota bacterium]
MYRLAIDIGSSRATLALVEGGTWDIVAHERADTGAVLVGQAAPGIELAAAAMAFLQAHRVNASELAGVGIGVPGIVDRKTGRVRSCPNLAVLNGADLGASMAEQLGVPAFTENDANLIALGEHMAGAGQGVEDLAVVSVGAGLGCGLILGGQLYHGANEGAGELGHTQVAPGGLLCSCGAHGCLEMYCSAKALAARAEGLLDTSALGGASSRYAGAQLLIEQARAGHAAAQEALGAAFGHLGIALINLVNLLNPRVIVLGGYVALAWPEGLDLVRDAIQREALPVAREHVEVRLSALEPYAGVLGGAALVSAGIRQEYA